MTPQPETAPAFTVPHLLAAWAEYADETTPSVRLSKAAAWFCMEHRVNPDCAEFVGTLIRQAAEEGQ